MRKILSILVLSSVFIAIAYGGNTIANAAPEVETPKPSATSGKEAATSSLAGDIVKLKDAGVSEEIIQDYIDTRSTRKEIGTAYLGIFILLLGVIIAGLASLARKTLKAGTLTADIGQLPLGLPRGSIRAVLTLFITIIIGLMLLSGTPIPDILRDAFLVVITFYFSGKAVAGTAAPQKATTGSIQGRVSGPDGKTPLPGVNIQLRGLDSSKTTTDKQGNYSIPNISPGIHTLVATKDGEETELPITVKAGEVITKDFQLEKEEEK